jgi:hypothetical protein
MFNRSLNMSWQVEGPYGHGKGQSYQVLQMGVVIFRNVSHSTYCFLEESRVSGVILAVGTPQPLPSLPATCE